MCAHQAPTALPALCPPTSALLARTASLDRSSLRFALPAHLAMRLAWYPFYAVVTAALLQAMDALRDLTPAYPCCASLVTTVQGGPLRPHFPVPLDIFLLPQAPQLVRNALFDITVLVAHWDKLHAIPQLHVLSLVLLHNPRVTGMLQRLREVEWQDMQTGWGQWRNFTDLVVFPLLRVVIMSLVIHKITIFVLSRLVVLLLL